MRKSTRQSIANIMLKNQRKEYGSLATENSDLDFPDLLAKLDGYLKSEFVDAFTSRVKISRRRIKLFLEYLVDTRKI
ncbi:6784_t:CDS:2, partial [Diversispora eburnea]